MAELRSFESLYYGTGKDGGSDGLSKYVVTDYFKTPCGLMMRESTYRSSEMINGSGPTHDYMMQLCAHIELVREFCLLYFPDYAWTTQAHDASKFCHEEFAPYVWYWHTDRSIGDKEVMIESYDAAWQRHLSINPHHWNFWAKEGKPIRMPRAYVYEMIADWHGAAKAYNGEYDISPWLNDNYGAIILHDDTKRLVWTTLMRLGYEYDMKGDEYILTKEL